MSGQPDAQAMQEAIDKMTIGEMQSRYMFALDWRDADMYASLFTDDAVLEWPEGRAEGKEAIRTSCERIGVFFDAISNATPNKKPFALRHFLTNQVFDIQGDTARAWAYWFDLSNDNMARWPYVAGYGYYEDDLVRTADGWRFSRRKVMNDISAESPREIPINRR